MRAAGGRGQVLILLATWLFFGGGAASALVAYGAVDPMGAAVKRALPKGERREAILADIRMWEAVQKHRDGIIAGDRDAILDILRRRDAQAEGVEPVAARLDASIGVMDREFLDLRLRVRGKVTREEWASISSRSGGN